MIRARRPGQPLELAREPEMDNELAPPGSIAALATQPKAIMPCIHAVPSLAAAMHHLRREARRLDPATDAQHRCERTSVRASRTSIGWTDSAAIRRATSTIPSIEREFRPKSVFQGPETVPRRELIALPQCRVSAWSLPPSPPL
jgi:hypothetical protein